MSNRKLPKRGGGRRVEERVRIDFACNDPDNGVFAGRVPQIHLPNEMLSLTAEQWDITSEARCPKLRIEGDEMIVLSGKQWPAVGSRERIGNWCWSAWWFEPATGWAFLRWLHGRRLFACEQAEEDVFQRWNGDREWPAEPDIAFLVRWAEAQ